MNPIDIISEYYEPESRLYQILTEHSRKVAEKAVEVAKTVSHLNPDIPFIREAAMLHDIGIFHTRAPSLGCEGDLPYVCHGYLGRALLEGKGLHRHALVCERHLGVGLTAPEIKRQKLPIPIRDMVPETIEEKIICYADKFYSKSNGSENGEKPVASIKKALLRYGPDKVERFEAWHRLFCGS